MTQLMCWLYCSVWYSEMFLLNIAAFISFPSLCFCMKCGGRTSVSHLFPFSWKIVPTLSLLSSLILWKLPRALLTHTFCAYCGWTSPNRDDTVLWANVFFSLWTWRFLSEDYPSIRCFEHLSSPDTLASVLCEGGSSWIIYSSMKTYQ